MRHYTSESEFCCLLAMAISLLGASLAVIPAAHAQVTPTNGVCINRQTGALSLQLADAADVVKPCPKTALSTTLASLQTLPVLPTSPTILVSRTLPAAAKALIPQSISTQPPTIIDVTGKTLGIFIGFDELGDAYAEMTFNGTQVEVPVTASGFTQTADGALMTFYTTTNCGSPPLMQIEESASGLQVVYDGVDLVGIGGQPPWAAPSAGIVGNTLFYGAPPFSNPVTESLMNFTNLANLNVISLGEGSCQNQGGVGGISGVQYGVPAAANLSGFTPPFSILQPNQE